MRNKKQKSGFTLIELLVVIAIIAILAVVVVLTLNPAELLKQSRDSSRISDLGTLKSGVSLYLVDTVSPNIASSTLGYSACYLSSTGSNATTTAKCGTFIGGYTANVTATVASYKNNNSTGWLPVNFSQIDLWVAAQFVAGRSDKQWCLLLLICRHNYGRILLRDQCIYGEQEI